jgi:SulP family sulfate permease
VISGFISASGLLITASQLKTLMGVKARAHLPDCWLALWRAAPSTHWPTLAIGVGPRPFPVWVRKGLKPLLCAWACPPPLPTPSPRPARWRPLPSPPG